MEDILFSLYNLNIDKEHEYGQFYHSVKTDAFKAGAEWMAGHGGYESGYRQAVEDVDRMIDEKLKAAGFVIADEKIVRAETKWH